MTFFFQTSFGRSLQRLQVIKERYFITILAVLREKNCWEPLKFFQIYCIPGTQISWKMTNFFFERYRPEICHGLHKWCCERILRRFRLFQAKNIFFENWQFFYFFAYPGSQISWKMANYFFEKYWPEICRGLHKWCCEPILRRLRLFQVKNFFFENWKFFDFFCISGVTDFLKNG